MLLFTTKPANKTPLRLIFTTAGFSSLTNQFLQLLLPWYILSTTGSILWTGVIAFCMLMPNIFSSLWGGTIIDRFGRSKTMLFCEVIQFLLIALIPLLIVLDQAKPWLIGIIIFFMSFFDAPGELARTALLPTFSRYANVPIHRSTGFVEALDGSMSVLGPLLGGVVIATFGLLGSWSFSVFFCLIIVSLSALIYNNRTRGKKLNTTTFSQAVVNIKGDKNLFRAILFTLPLFILGQSWELLILPGYVHEHGFGTEYFGLLGAAFGLGAFAGALLFSAAAQRFKFFTLLIINYVGYAVSVWVIMCSFPKIIVLGANLFCGLPFGAFSAMLTTIILTHTPEELRGKTLGIFAAAAYVIESVCVVGIAFFMQYRGLNQTLGAILALFIALTLITVIRRAKDDFWAIAPATAKALPKPINAVPHITKLPPTQIPAADKETTEK